MPPTAPPQPNMQAIEQTINRKLTVVTGVLSLRIVGSLGFPLLTLLSWPGQVYLALTFIRQAWQEWKSDRVVGVNAIDAIMLSFMPLVGYATSVTVYFGAVIASQKILLRTRNKSRQELVNIFGEAPRHVWIKHEGVEVEIPFEELQVGATIVVHAGETVPADGTIIEGMASIDQQRLTGEAQPVELGPGDSVLAATIVLAGTISIKVTQAGSETIAAQIGTILNQTAEYQSPLEFEGERLANVTAPPMLAASALSLPLFGVAPSLAMLTSSPGYHLRVTAPISLLNFLKLATAQGVLVKDGRALEMLSKIDTVVFDKTGTLTQETPHVSAIYCCEGYLEGEVLRYAAAAEYRQTHPIALAILQTAEAQQLALPAIQDAAYEVGYGIQVALDNQQVRVGSQRFMVFQGITIPSEFESIEAYSHENGASLVYVAVDEHLCGAIEMQPTIRPEAREVVQALRARDIEVAIISGDHQQPTERLAQTLGIDRYFAETLPEQKASLVENLQQAGKTVCFVGDGINDAVALKQADVSISLSGASTIAIDTAEVILMDGHLTQLIPLFDLGRDLAQNMRTNRIESLIPCCLCIGGVYLLGFTISTTMMLNYLLLNVGILNAMLPALRRRVK
ncbi:MAG: heavy metal translocating P-type ATPase [Chloroflexota bacterium]